MTRLETIVRYLPLVPVFEMIEEGEELRCAECNRLFGEDEEAVYWGDVHRCEACSEKLAEIVEADAAEFAEENCKITKALPKYNPLHEFRCTREDYESGYSKESYTRNSHLCYCRHNCTNYDELIKGLNRFDHSLENQILYQAIRCRIDELLEEQIEEDGDEGVDDLLDGDDNFEEI